MTRPHHYQKQPDLRVRPCLCCRKPFESEWIGNRLCIECRAEDIETPQFNRDGAKAGAVG